LGKQPSYGGQFFEQVPSTQTSVPAGHCTLSKQTVLSATQSPPHR
jgi:hypothetical protein